jgi:hypothetical protein
MNICNCSLAGTSACNTCQNNNLDWSQSYCPPNFTKFYELEPVHLSSAYDFCHAWNQYKLGLIDLHELFDNLDSLQSQSSMPYSYHLTPATISPSSFSTAK